MNQPTSSTLMIRFGVAEGGVLTPPFVGAKCGDPVDAFWARLIAGTTLVIAARREKVRWRRSLFRPEVGRTNAPAGGCPTLDGHDECLLKDGTENYEIMAVALRLATAVLRALWKLHQKADADSCRVNNEAAASEVVHRAWLASQSSRALSNQYRRLLILVGCGN